MATVRVSEHHITLVLGPLEQFAAVHQGDIVVDLDDIDNVQAVDVARAYAPSIHFPGVDIPGLAKVGKFVSGLRGDARNDKIFAAAHGSRPGYVITTKSGEPFQRIIVSTPPVSALDELVGGSSSGA